MSRIPAREIGDLYITGAGLSPGYWRDPAKTAAAFIPDPKSPQDPTRRLYRTGDLAYRDEQGLVWFVGRADTQIKVRGYRIELGEIETALNSMPKLQECAVVAIPTDNFGGYMICAAYVVRGGEERNARRPARTPQKARAELHDAGALDRLRSAAQERQRKN